MNQIITAIIVATLVGGGMYWQLEKANADWEEKYKIALDSRPASYGQLSKVNRVELATTTVQQKCTAEELTLIGDSIIDFEWEMEFAYGIDLPPSFEWKIDEISPKKGKVILPMISQLRPTMVEFSRIREIDPSSGDRWELLIGRAQAAASQWLELEQQNKLANDRNVIESARSSAAKFLLPLIREANPDLKYTELEVIFDGEEELEAQSARIYPDKCVLASA
ncbi:hypothetical protein [Microbulbifer agarilyticus]|uniref:hypothetical protein n=1 Tax=Microbulbifer agarilyticus TaxID=260552 RepID=UPI001CD20826|nr:hypothetical protein [Microbulbifer agarilyticus]MCA0894598.1 hypothetical protein [Microbulbifer agarilyticus]